MWNIGKSAASNLAVFFLRMISQGEGSAHKKKERMWYLQSCSKERQMSFQMGTSGGLSKVQAHPAISFQVDLDWQSIDLSANLDSPFVFVLLLLEFRASHVTYGQVERTDGRILNHGVATLI